MKRNGSKTENWGTEGTIVGLRFEMVHHPFVCLYKIEKSLASNVWLFVSAAIVIAHDQVHQLQTQIRRSLLQGIIAKM